MDVRPGVGWPALALSGRSELIMIIFTIGVVPYFSIFYIGLITINK